MTCEKPLIMIDVLVVGGTPFGGVRRVNLTIMRRRSGVLCFKTADTEDTSPMFRLHQNVFATQEG